MGLTCCPTGHSTATSPQLAVPARYETLSILQFWKISAVSARSDVETSESFSRLWLALGSPNFQFLILASILVVDAKMQPIFGLGSGICDPTLTIGQSGFVEIRSNSVRFSTFLGTEWEFLHAVFTTMRYFLINTKKRALGLPGYKTQSTLEILTLLSGTPETGQKSRFFDL